MFESKTAFKLLDFNLRLTREKTRAGAVGECRAFDTQTNIYIYTCENLCMSMTHLDESNIKRYNRVKIEKNDWQYDSCCTKAVHILSKKWKNIWLCCMECDNT
jgi:hypothetical protein